MIEERLGVEIPVAVIRREDEALRCAADSGVDSGRVTELIERGLNPLFALALVQRN